MKHCALLLAAALALSTAPASARSRAGADYAQALASAVPPALARHKVPAMSIALVRDGRLVMARTWGHAAPGRPADDRTLFNVASLTKPITAETALRLAAAGELDLDSAMASHWVDPDIATDRRRWLLTPRLALSHQGGFANWRSETGNTLKFVFSPGNGVRYSGEGYEYFGRYVTRKSGETLDSLAQRLVFSPAGMSATSYSRRDWFAERIAHPSREGEWLEPDIADTAIASDQLHTSATDYARFLASLIRGDGLTTALFRERGRIHADQTRALCKRPEAGTCPDEAGFGLGWQIFRFGRRRFMMHTGSDQGEFSLAYWSADTREAAVVLTNGAGGGAALLEIIDQLGIDGTFLAYLKTQAGG